MRDGCVVYYRRKLIGQAKTVRTAEQFALNCSLCFERRMREYKDYSHVKEITGPSYEFNMDINTVGLTPEGDVILKTEGDLAAAVGWQPTIASGVKDIYAKPFGNGGFYSILMLKEDGTVSAVNTAKLRDENVIEIMDNLGGYQDVVTVEGETTVDAMLINAVMSNGDKYPLDPYLK
jgi:hypothetical protein